jgi:response regulator of citrate/malate metabolism
MSKDIDLSELVVLVIDDDAMVRDILIDYLKLFGFQRIISARNAQTAMPIVQDAKQHLDLIVSDWEMPGGDGLSILQAVRKNPARAGLRFMMVTSQNSMERSKISRAAKWKVDAYLIKPFRGEVFKQKVFEVLAAPPADGGTNDKKKAG